MLNTVAVLDYISTPASSYESIATGTVVSNGNITFTSIPNTYKHLQLRMLVKYSTTGSNYTFIRLNGDSTGGNYYGHYLEGNGTSAAAGAPNQQGTNASLIMTNRIPGTDSTNVYAVAVVDILDYANTSKNKTVRSLWGYDANGSGYVGMNSGLWMNTAAITSIDIAGYNTNMLNGSTVALYGVKG